MTEKIILELLKLGILIGVVFVSSKIIVFFLERGCKKFINKMANDIVDGIDKAFKGAIRGFEKEIETGLKK